MAFARRPSGSRRTPRATSKRSGTPTGGRPCTWYVFPRLKRRVARHPLPERVARAPRATAAAARARVSKKNPRPDSRRVFCRDAFFVRNPPSDRAFGSRNPSSSALFASRADSPLTRSLSLHQKKYPGGATRRSQNSALLSARVRVRRRRERQRRHDAAHGRRRLRARRGGARAPGARRGRRGREAGRHARRHTLTA